MSGKPIFVSKHAIKRLRERFRLSFASGNFEHDTITISLILGQLGKAKHCIKWKLVPFYTNMIGTKYKHPIEVYKNGPVFYVVAEEPTRFVVVTVVPRWLCD